MVSVWVHKLRRAICRLLGTKNESAEMGYSTASPRLWSRALASGLPIVFVIGLGQGVVPARAEEEEEVETLAPIEVPGTVVTRKPRQFTFPVPAWEDAVTPPFPRSLSIPDPITVTHPPEDLPVLVDPTGKTRGVRTPVVPLNAVRPPYPRFAREQGWEGTVVLRLTIGPDGRVVSAKTHTSSGYAILDRSALQAVRQWTFKPAKDGEFPISATVDLPIRFDLRAER
ncbi:MAG: energy transducer TonB [Nitrospirae bacterium]|nr:MAG: energy transducer TonB [Nitrospirota bacterium]